MISNSAPSANVSAFSNVACLFANSSAHVARTAIVTVMSQPVTLPAPVNVERKVGRVEANCSVAPDSTRTAELDGTTPVVPAYSVPSSTAIPPVIVLVA